MSNYRKKIYRIKNNDYNPDADMQYCDCCNDCKDEFYDKCQKWPHSWIHCIQGPRGPKGARGEIGERGCIGPRGPKGEVGCPGPAGVRGPCGPRGDIGPQGCPGPMGKEGPQGPIGPEGPQGLQGIEGAAGPTGPEGPIGQRGCPGPQGEMGPQGETGPAGPRGIAGPEGPQGIPGPPGVASNLIGGQFAATNTPGSGGAVIGNGGTFIFNTEITGGEPDICYNSKTGEIIFNRNALYVVCITIVAVNILCGNKTTLKLKLNGKTAVSHDIVLNKGCYNHLNFTDVISICEPGTVLTLVNCGAPLKLTCKPKSAAEITIFGIT